MFVVCTPEQSDAMLDELVALEKQLYSELGLHFRVLRVLLRIQIQSIYHYRRLLSSIEFMMFMSTILEQCAVPSTICLTLTSLSEVRKDVKELGFAFVQGAGHADGGPGRARLPQNRLRGAADCLLALGSHPPCSVAAALWLCVEWCDATGTAGMWKDRAMSSNTLVSPLASYCAHHLYTAGVDAGHAAVRRDQLRQQLHRLPGSTTRVRRFGSDYWTCCRLSHACCTLCPSTSKSTCGLGGCLRRDTRKLHKAEQFTL